METFANRENRRISLWLPESFEYIILKSGLISSPEIERILESVSDYVECEKYESWERFFTNLLEKLTKELPQPYSKQRLPAAWLSAPEKEKIINEFPEAIRENM